MNYDFFCDQHRVTETVSCRMVDAPPPTPLCPVGKAEHPMRRLYGVQQIEAPIQLTKAEYIEKAYRGEEKVPGLSLRNIRGMVDNDVRAAQKGRRNNHDYGDKRRLGR